MRRPHRLAPWPLIAAFVIAASACGEPPRKEMDQAQGAIDAARAAGAEQYAAQEYRQAVLELERSHAAAGERDYRQALSQALAASESAQGAARAAADRKAVARGEAERALHRAEMQLAATRQRLEAARAARVPASQVTRHKAVVDGAEPALARMRHDIAQGRFKAVLASLDALGDHLAQTQSEIDAAIAARSPRRPARRGTR